MLCFLKYEHFITKYGNCTRILIIIVRTYQFAQQMSTALIEWVEKFPRLSPKAASISAAIVGPDLSGEAK